LQLLFLDALIEGEPRFRACSWVPNLR
jgi:hypothetical protein